MEEGGERGRGWDRGGVEEGEALRWRRERHGGGGWVGGSWRGLQDSNI